MDAGLKALNEGDVDVVSSLSGTKECAEPHHGCTACVDELDLRKTSYGVDVEDESMGVRTHRTDEGAPRMVDSTELSVHDIEAKAAADRTSDFVASQRFVVGKNGYRELGTLEDVEGLLPEVLHFTDASHDVSLATGLGLVWIESVRRTEQRLLDQGALGCLNEIR